MGRLVTAKTEPQQVVYAGRGPVLLVNRDVSAQVILSDIEGGDPGGQSVNILDPLGSLALDGETDQWAQTITGSAIVEVCPGGRGWSPSPAQIAAQMLAAGLAKDTTVQGVSTTLGSPGQDDTLYQRYSLLPPLKSGVGWGETNCTFTINATPPAGGTREQSMRVTPSGTATGWTVQGQRVAISPGELLDVRCFAYATAITAGQTYNLVINWLTSAGASIGTTTQPLSFVTSFWIHQSISAIAPANTALARFQITATGASGSIPASDLLDIEDLTVHGSVSGMGPQNVQPITRAQSAINQGPGTFNLVTLSNGGRLWALWLSAGYSAGSSYVAGANFTATTIVSAALGTLAEITLSLQTPSSAQQDSLIVPFTNPVFLPTGDVLSLSVNGGTAITGVTQRGSGGVLYSTP